MGFSHLWRIVSWEQWLSQILRILLDFLQWINSGKKQQKEICLRIKKYDLNYWKPFARESDTKFNQEQGEESQWIFHKVWKLKSTYSGKSGCPCVHAATVAAKKLQGVQMALVLIMFVTIYVNITAGRIFLWTNIRWMHFFFVPNPVSSGKEAGSGCQLIPAQN